MKKSVVAALKPLPAAATPSNPLARRSSPRPLHRTTSTTALSAHTLPSQRVPISSTRSWTEGGVHLLQLQRQERLRLPLPGLPLHTARPHLDLRRAPHLTTSLYSKHSSPSRITCVASVASLATSHSLPLSYHVGFIAVLLSAASKKQSRSAHSGFRRPQ